MPNQQSHHVSSFIFRISCLPAPSLSRVFRISSLGFRISPDPSGRIMRNEPKKNRRPQACRPVFNPGLSAGDAPTPPTTWPTPQNTKRTQSPYGHGMPCPYLAKQTQFTPRRTCGRPKMRNEPNPSTSILRKRTQFPLPLSSRASGCGAKRSGPKPRDLFNHHRRRRFRAKNPQPAKNAKRTQS